MKNYVCVHTDADQTKPGLLVRPLIRDMNSCDPAARLMVRHDMPCLSSGKWVFV